MKSTNILSNVLPKSKAFLIFQFELGNKAEFTLPSSVDYDIYDYLYILLADRRIIKPVFGELIESISNTG